MLDRRTHTDAQRYAGCCEGGITRASVCAYKQTQGAQRGMNESDRNCERRDRIIEQFGVEKKEVAACTVFTLHGRATFVSGEGTAVCFCCTALFTLHVTNTAGFIRSQ